VLPPLFATKLDLPRPLRSTKTLAALLLAGCASIAFYTLARNDHEFVATTPSPQVTRQPVDARPATPSIIPPAESTPAIDSTPTETPATVPLEKLIKDATEGDADARADAIFALASVPAAQGVPVLHGIIVSGDIVNGHLALDSLRTIALSQGDPDGAIRNSVRFAVYHGASDTITESAREVLDELERPAPASP